MAGQTFFGQKLQTIEVRFGQWTSGHQFLAPSGYILPRSGSSKIGKLAPQLALKWQILELSGRGKVCTDSAQN